MRIVRPGSVVGPQQQYIYLKQLEWAKWAAVDEMRRVQAATALASATLVTPATPPAETDEELELMRTTTPPPSGPTLVSVPPVTPGKHVANAAARAKAMAPPGQPRKTPIAKRAARDSDEDEEDDVLPALGVAPVTRARANTAKAAASRGITSSEQRPTRVTRSTAGAAAIRKTGTASTAQKSAQGPNKIPRLAATRTTAAAKAAAASSKQATSRRPPPPPSPTPSRLPTLIPSKRPHPNHTSSLSEVKAGASTTLKPGTTLPAASDAWMTTNAAAVVVPGTKSERPGLRNVRRRRSSFSSADVIA